MKLSWYSLCVVVLLSVFISGYAKLYTQEPEPGDLRLIDCEGYKAGVDINGVFMGYTPYLATLQEGDRAEIGHTITYIYSHEYDDSITPPGQSQPKLLCFDLTNKYFLVNNKPFGLQIKSRPWNFATNNTNHIRHVSLDQADVTEALAEQLAKIKSMKSLTIYHDRLTEKMLNNLRKLEQLEFLKISTAVEHLHTICNFKSLSQLRSLDIAYSISAQEILELQQLKNLQYLRLSGITDEHVESIAKLKNLKSLSLAYLQLTAVGWDTLSSLPYLQSLASDFSDKTNILGLSKISHLRTLHLETSPQYVHLLKTLYNLTSLSIRSYDRESFTEHEWCCLQDLKELNSLDIYECKVSYKGLRYLKGMQKLQSLCIRTNTNIEPEELDNVRYMKSLRQLVIPRSKIGDKSLAALQELPNLNFLDISEGGISDAGLSHLEKLTKLTYLNISWNKLLSDKCLAKLQKLSQLKSLSLMGIHFQGNGFQHLKNCRQLHTLQLLGSSLADDVVVYIAQLPTIHSLTLWNTSITDQGIASLRGHPSLTSLDLSGADNLTNRCIEYLVEIPQLQYLVFSCSSLIDDGCANSFAKMKNLRSLYLEEMRIGDASVQYLKKMANLEMLSVRATLVTAEGIKKLQQALPACEVNY